MIEQFGIPGWVHLLLRLTGRHFRHSTGWVRRGKRGASPAGAEIVFQSAADPQMTPPPLAKAKAVSPAGNVTYVLRGLDSDLPGTAMAAVSSAAYSEGRLTQSFLAAARAMEERTRGLVAATIGEPAG